MEKLIEISVLTPIYNHNIKYVQKCLESLMAQTLQKIEFILIDNGANQESKKLIEEFLKKDKRFKVIHIEKNQGYGYAMNQGLKLAQGEYIGIVESDDIINKNMYLELANIAKTTKADIVKSLFSFYKNEAIQNIGITFDNKKYNKILKPKDVPEYCEKYGAYWSAIYNKKSLIKHEILWDELPSPSSEDIMFTIKTYCLFDSLYILDKPLYYHRMDNDNSSIHQKDEVALNCIKCYEKLDTFLEAKNISEDLWLIKNKREIMNLVLNYTNKRVTKKRLEYILTLQKRFKTIDSKNSKINTSRYYGTFKSILKHPYMYYFKTSITNNQFFQTIKKILLICKSN